MTRTVRKTGPAAALALVMLLCALAAGAGQAQAQSGGYRFQGTVTGAGGAAAAQGTLIEARIGERPAGTTLVGERRTVPDGGGLHGVAARRDHGEVSGRREIRGRGLVPRKRAGLPAADAGPEPERGGNRNAGRGHANPRESRRRRRSRLGSPGRQQRERSARSSGWTGSRYRPRWRSGQ